MATFTLAEFTPTTITNSTESTESSMKIRMFITGVLLFGGIATAGAPIAAADDFNGKYAFRPGVGATTGEFSSVWAVTPWGDACRRIVTSTGATDTEARLEGQYWAFDKFVDPGIECPGNSYNMQKKKLPATMHFRIDPETLVGQYQPVGTPCGGTPLPTGFSLTKTLD